MESESMLQNIKKQILFWFKRNKYNFLKNFENSKENLNILIYSKKIISLMLDIFKEIAQLQKFGNFQPFI